MTPAAVKDTTPGESTCPFPGGIYVVPPDDYDTPASCGSVSVSDDCVPVPDGQSSGLCDGAPAFGKGTPAPVDADPAVIDYFSSFLHAY